MPTPSHGWTPTPGVSAATPTGAWHATKGLLPACAGPSPIGSKQDVPALMLASRQPPPCLPPRRLPETLTRILLALNAARPNHRTSHQLLAPVTLHAASHPASSAADHDTPALNAAHPQKNHPLLQYCHPQTWQGPPEGCTPPGDKRGMTRQTSKQGELAAAAAAPNNNTSQCSKVPTAAMLELTGAGDWLTLDSWQPLPRQVKGQCHNKADGNSFHHHAMQLPCAAQTCGPTSSLLAAMPAQLGLQQTGTHWALQAAHAARHTYSKTHLQQDTCSKVPCML